MPKIVAEQIPLSFKRNCIAGLPDKLERLASKPSAASEKQNLLDCAKLLRERIGTHQNDIPLSRPYESWQWLKGAAKAAGELTFATLIDLKLHEREVILERRAEREDFDRRTADALAEYRAGGGE